MKLMESILQSGAIQALGWTLVHAVWQIAGVAFLLMLALALLRGHSSRIRYGAALTAMIAVVALSAGTFLLSYRYFTGQEAVQFAAAPAPLGMDAAVPGLFDGLNAFLYHYLFLFLSVWFIGVTLLSFRFAGSMYMLRRLRLSALPVPTHWAGAVSKMAREMGIDRAVRLAESALVAAPVMIGHLKPLILVPAGMLAAIPTDQVEAILAHELAHIRRNDFLINLLQSVAEIVYFFHPGIWWISKVVRRERELCCDDLATRGGCHPVTLAFALSEIGERMQAERDGKLVLAFSGKKEQPLLARVKRLLGQEPPRSSGFLPAGTVALAVVAFLLLSGSGRVFSSSAEGEPAPSRQVGQTEATWSRSDTVPSSNGNASVEVRRGRAEPGGEDEASGGEDTSGFDQAGSDQAVIGSMEAPEDEQPPKPPVFTMDMSELPQPPVPDSMPPVPAPPSPPAIPDSASWSQFQQQMEGLGAAIADWTKNIKVNDKGVEFPDMQITFDKEQMKEFERSMETFGEEMGKWGEAYGEKIAAWAKTNEPRMKEFEQKMKRWEKENEPRIKEYEQKMEDYEQKMQQYKQRVEDRAQRQAERTEEELERKRERLERNQEREERIQEKLERDQQRREHSQPSQDVQPENQRL